MKRRLLSLCLGVLVAFFGLEGLMRVVIALGDGVPDATTESQENEWEWAAEHLEAGTAVFDSTLTYDPRFGWRSRANLDTEQLGTNSEGWRGRAEHSQPKAPGVRRLLLVGDSYTFGAGVADEEAFAHVLGELLGPGWEVVNISAPGWGTDQQILAFEEEGLGYDPDMVVLGFFVRDYSRNLLSFRQYFKPRFALEGNGLRLVGGSVPTPEAVFDEYVGGERQVGGSWYRSRFIDKCIGSWRKFSDRNIHRGAVGWELVARLMERFHKRTGAEGMDALWMVIPTDETVAGTADRYITLAGLCEEQAEALGLELLSLTPEIIEHNRLHPDELVSRPAELGGHFSPAGHRLVAEQIHRWVLAKGG